MSKLTDFGLPDLYARKKEQEINREKEEQLLLGLIKKAKKITYEQIQEELKFEITTQDDFKAVLTKINWETFKKLYPEVVNALRVRGFIPLAEL